MIFPNKHFAFTNEISEKMKIYQGNFSQIVKKYDLELYEDYLKLNGALFLNLKSSRIPEQTKRHYDIDRTDFSNALYSNYIYSEIGIHVDSFLEHFHEYVMKKEIIAGKLFVFLNEAGVKFFSSGYQFASFSREEFEDIQKDKSIKIEGFARIKYKYLVWY